jgi:hypothetical protein
VPDPRVDHGRAPAGKCPAARDGRLIASGGVS